METSSEIVMDWVHYLGYECYRMNGEMFEQLDKSISINSNNEIEFFIDGVIQEREYYSIWFRRWSDYQSMENISELCEQNKVGQSLSRILLGCFAQNSTSIEDFVLDNFKAKKFLTTKSQKNVNKITVLIEAKKCGLNVPSFLLTTRKDELLKYIKVEKKVVVKELEGQFTFQKNNKRYLCYVDYLDSEKLKAIPEIFMLSFFQRYIEKIYEIRAFILNGKIYSMAIFSQADPMTKIDFRRYNNLKPNKKVPYKLPDSVEKKN